MLQAAGALKLAIDLMHLPSQVRSVRSAPLPDDVRVLLRIVSGDEMITSQAVEWTGRSRDVVHEAAAFFIEQILLYRGADSYRVLGSTPEAPYSELRHNMALLLRWLHPDRGPEQQRAVFSARVTRAWNDLKTKERRAAYDRLRRVSNATKLSRTATSRPRGHAPTLQRNYSRHSGHAVASWSLYSEKGRGFLRRILLQMFGRITL
jgi:hypothetical protein